MGILYSSSMLLGMLLAACAAVYVEDSQSAKEKPLLRSISSCKRECKTALHLCLDKLGKSKAVRYECIKSYMTTFPKCYVKAGKSSCFDILKSYSKCVMESTDYSENFACFNAMNAAQARIKSTSSDISDSIIEKRSNVKDCNDCRDNSDTCMIIATSDLAVRGCSINKDICFTQHGCNR